MRRLLLVLVMVLALTLATAVPAFAQGPGDGGPPSEEQACTFVGEQGAPISWDEDEEECVIAAPPTAVGP